MAPKHEYPRKFIDPSAPAAHLTVREKLHNERAERTNFAIVNDPWVVDPWVGGRHRGEG